MPVDYRIKHASHGAVFAVYDTGVVRILGPEENEHLGDQRLLTTTNSNEYNRLICASWAAMGLEPPKANADGV